MKTNEEKKFYLYIIKKNGEDIIKVGITKNIFSRMTGKYENKNYDGLMFLNIDLDNSFYVELQSESLRKYLEDKIKEYNKEYRIIYNKEISGFTEWFKNGNYILSNIKDFLSFKNKIIPLNTIFKN